MMNVTRTPPNHTAIQRAFANPATLGANTLVASPGASARIRVVSASIIVDGANDVKFQSASTDISGLMAFAANGGIVLPFNEHGWVETAAGEALNLNLSAATAVGITFQYIVLP